MSKQTKTKPITIEEGYKQRLPSYTRIEEEADFILRRSLNRESVKIHALVSRIKTLDSIKNKALRLNLASPLDGLTDIVGLRVICLFRSDLPKIGAAIRSEFSVLSEDNKLEDYEVEFFGYLSVHFVAQLPRSYKGPRYDGLHQTRFEIQVRTIAMDTWATISHYLDYKSDLDVPKELRKDFYALSGILYLCDTHFEMFSKATAEERSSIEKSFSGKHRGLAQEINMDTLTLYLHSRFPDRKHGEPKTVSELVSELSRAGYTTLQAIEDDVTKGWKAFLALEKKHPPVSESRRYADVGVARAVLSLVRQEFLEARGGGRQDMYDRFRKLIDDKSQSGSKEDT